MPPAAATPTLGEQPDGTRVWKVLVGGMDMANLIDVNAFLPGTLTINAGDSVYFEFGMGFHTVAFHGPEARQPVVIPDPNPTPAATPMATPSAAAGVPRLIINPAVVFPTNPAGGDVFDGTGDLTSGVGFFRAAAPDQPPVPSW